MQISKIITNNHGFTLIELIVGMMIFSIAMTGILALLGSTIANSKNVELEIVAGNLLREQVELVRNLRDTYKKNYVPFSKMATGTFWVENDYTKEKFSFDASTPTPTLESPIFLSGSFTLETTSSGATFDQNRLYLDEHGRFTHTATATGTRFASYTIITDDIPKVGKIVKEGNNQALFVDARVMIRMNNNAYREYDLKTLVTDF